MYAICMQIFPAALRDPVGPVRLQLPASRCQDQHVPRKGGIGGNADILSELVRLVDGGAQIDVLGPFVCAQQFQRQIASVRFGQGGPGNSQRPPGTGRGAG